MLDRKIVGRAVRGTTVGIVGASFVFATASATQPEQSRPNDRPAAPQVVHPDRALPLTPERGMDDLPAPILAPNHPPFDQIPPMPMPEVVDTPTRIEQTQPIVHDAETGETWRLPLTISREDAAGIGGEQYVGADGRVEDIDPAALGFGDMFTVGPATTFPRRGNAKLIMRFVDENGNNRFFSGSGTMIDAGVVLTAGHCVYARDPNGIDIFDFASEIWVYPGWDGNSDGSIFNPPGSNEVIEYWGWSRGTAFGSWTGWTENGDFNWDLGLIRLSRQTSRSVGVLTGWFAWAFGGNCSFSQNTNYQNYSFPSENCPTSGLHTGRDMYYWTGTYDDCVDSNRLEIDTGGNCLDSVWGGMSGSGAYYVDDGDVRRLHAVCSYRQSGASPSYGGYVRIWEAFHDFMVTFRSDTRGTVFDAEALQYRIDGPLEVPQGESMDGGSVTIANVTNGSDGADDRVLRVYLSIDNNITAADTLLAVWNYSDIDFSPMQLYTFNVPGPTIPVSTPPGDYWVGVILDSATDSNSFNNATRLWDAQPITVLGDPDSCAGICGDQAPSGCWCDSGCVGFGDCCDDACVECDACYTGACCLEDQTCQLLTEAECEAADGLYHGDQSTCTGVDCPDFFSCEGYCGDQAPGGCWCDSSCVGFGDCCDDACEQCNECEVGACCFLDGSCGQMAINDCADLGGFFHGNGVTCDSVSCPVDPALCPANLNGDQAVDVSDLLALLSAWGSCGSCESCPADISGDCTVDVSDLLTLLSAWGPCGCGAGLVCGETIPWCNDDETCACLELYTGGTVCMSASTPCAGGCPDGTCPPGYICVVNTCCGPAICVPAGQICDE